MKKKVIAFTIADENNMKYAKMLENSLRKFHSEEELPFVIYSPKQWELNKDPHFFYRACPYYAKELIKEYDLVLKLDADQIITGDLGHILDDTGYEVGTVLNWNRVDPTIYGEVRVWDINADKYMNCGLVAMRSEAFINHWWALCQSEHFNVYQYREQDLLNILLHYGMYNYKCFDWGETWNGLIAKGEWPRTQIIDNKLVIMPQQLDNGAFFPEKPKLLKVLHWAGGAAGTDKMNYRIGFPEEVVEYIDELVK
jgi:hypothetical protein